MVRGQVRLRLLFDEQMSSGVAEALKALEKDVVHVASKRSTEGVGPKKKISDGRVAEIANREKRVVLTVNFDMVLAACDRGARFIWFDQRSRNLTKMETAFILLKRWDEWERVMARQSVVCLKVGRGTKTVLTVEQAQQRALRRYRRAQANKQRTRASVAGRNQLQLDFTDE